MGKKTSKSQNANCRTGSSSRLPTAIFPAPGMASHTRCQSHLGMMANSIYFHSSKAGKKLDILKVNPRVCLSFETGVEIFEDANQACKWSFKFKSVIADGIAEEIKQPAKKAEALNSIMNHYSDRSWTFPEQELSRLRVWKVSLVSISGKRSL